MKFDFKYLRQAVRLTASRKNYIRKTLSLVLVFALSAQLRGGALVYAEEPSDGLCPHHTEHTAECGYVQAVEGSPCGHVHDEACGYVEPRDAAPCGHVHDEACGYAEAVEETPCSMNCAETDENGAVIHVPGCAYRPGTEAQPCNHVHDEDCGYAEASEGAPCGHVHDEACGYKEAVEGQPCGFVCAECAAEQERKTAARWEWADEEVLVEWNDGAGCYALGVPGASEDAPLTPDALAELLPKTVRLQLSDGGSDPAALTWDLSAIPSAGVWSGSYLLTASLPEGFSLAEDAPELKVLLEVGGAGTYRDPVKAYPVNEDGKTHKFVSNWEYVPVGDMEKPTCDENFLYSAELTINIPSKKDVLIKLLSKSLPQQIECEGYNSGNLLVSAGFEPKDKPAGINVIRGFVNLEWNVEQVVNAAGTIQDGSKLVFDAKPVSNSGYLIRVNTNDLNYKDTSYTEKDKNYADTAEVDGILNLTVTIRDLNIPLEDHIVPSAAPAATVNLFDYWVDTDGAEGNDILPKSERHNGPNVLSVERTTVKDWNKGINVGRLLLFGDGLIHAGYWNKGAGAITDFGKKNAGMMGLVQKTLTDGYPVINTGDMNESIVGYQGISDNMLCGDHDSNDTAASGSYSYKSIDPKNISNTVINAWKASRNSASLDYLFDPEIPHNNKRSYTDVKGLFQLDDEGYYYYDMRQNFAEFDEDSNRFILYDAPAVDRTDESYTNDGGGFAGGRSVGNFFPFNKGSEVFTGLKEVSTGGVKSTILDSNDTVQSTGGKGIVDCNHHLGMTVTVNFRQPDGGVINTGGGTTVPMTFQFSGDDDVWVFIDDVLVLDLGGIHSEIFGTIDFSTGEVMIGQSWKTNGFPRDENGKVLMDELQKVSTLTTDLKALYKAADMEESVQWNNNTFAGNSNHTLKMFYLERGNYDSSLALRFNLQPQLYQSIMKVDQNGKPISGVAFDLYPAEESTNSSGIQCLYTDSDVHDKKIFYVTQSSSTSLATLKTNADGGAQFKQADGEPFSFADQRGDYYILKEQTPPPGYRALPTDIVLRYDRKTSMLSVANRWSTGAYACSVSNVMGTGNLTYGNINPSNGSVTRGGRNVTIKTQASGLAVAVPMLYQPNQGAWEALYGGNMSGFDGYSVQINSSESDPTPWREAVLKAALAQAAGDSNNQWFLSWDSENQRLNGTLNDLPGLASRYELNSPASYDMRMIYGVIEPEALQALNISENTPQERYTALGEYVKNYGIEETMGTIMGVNASYAGNSAADNQTGGSGKGFSFLNTSQFNRNFRSLIYIPNEQRELWVVKVDEDGKPLQGAVFGLYRDENCTDLAVSGTTDSEGRLIFSPRTDASQGYAHIAWATSSQTHYYLREISAPNGLLRNETVIPIVVGTYSIYADAGTPEDGVSVMAGVGRLTQTMRQFASNGKIDITLRDITAFGQAQPSKNTNVQPKDWVDTALNSTTPPGAVKRSMNLHFGKNAAVDYGLHDQDGGKLYKPFFITDTGFIRARVQQNYAALTADGMYDPMDTSTNKDNLGDLDITSLFSLLNIVLVTDRSPSDSSATGQLSISKTVQKANEADDYTRNFQFKVELTNAAGTPLSGSYHFWGRDRVGTIKHGDTIYLHHDDEITIQGLPAGTKFKVTEAKPEAQEGDWHIYPSDGVIEGEITKNVTVSADFINSRNPIPEPKTGTLTIRKTVTGAQGDQNKVFSFTVTLTSQDGTPLTGDFAYTGDVRGTIRNGGSVKLKHGQSITIKGLPVGTTYIVTESDNEGYEVTSSGKTGTIQKESTPIAAFTNKKGGLEPSTGSLTVRKLWNGDQEADRPASIVVQLKQNGVNYGEPVTLTRGSDWKHTWTGLPLVDENGNPYTYSVEELSRPDGYLAPSYSNQSGIILALPTSEILITNVKTGDDDVDNDDDDDDDDDNKGDDDDKKDDDDDDDDDNKGDDDDDDDDNKGDDDDDDDNKGDDDDDDDDNKGDDDDDDIGDDDDDDTPPPPETPETPPEEPPEVPENPGYPTELPDPNAPGAPDEITIWEDGVPRTYVRIWDPEEEEWVWVPEDEIPLGLMEDVPPTGDGSPLELWGFLGTASLTGLWILQPGKLRKKEEEE